MQRCFILATVYDRRKSFYNKAKVYVLGNGELVLESYNSLVAVFKNNTLEVFGEWECSQTTLRHVKEFARQNHVFVNQKKDLLQYQTDKYNNCFNIFDIEMLLKKTT